MEKSPQAFRTISEVSETIDVPAHVLRFWESRFSQIRPVKRGGGRRYYRPEDISLLTAIRELLYTEGFTIRGVQKLLRESGVKDIVAKYADGDATPGAAPAEKPKVAETVGGSADDEDDSSLWEDMPEEGLADMPGQSDAATPAEAGQPRIRDPQKIQAMKSILTRLEALRDKMISERDE